MRENNLTDQKKKSRLNSLLNFILGPFKSDYGEPGAYLESQKAGESLSSRSLKLLELEEVFREKYGLTWDGYYTIHKNISSDIKEINLQDKEQVRLFITYLLNKGYLKSCRICQVQPKSMIVLPEHLINTYEIFRCDCSNREGYLIERIFDILKMYEAKNGEIYYSCYEKYLGSIIEEIQGIRRLRGNGVFIDYSHLLPDYRKRYKLFKFNNIIPDGKGNLNKDEKRNIEILEEIISMLIPEKYWVSSKLIFKERGLNESEDEGIEGVESYLPKSDSIKLYYNSGIDKGMHEFGHAVVQHHKEVKDAVCDILFEVTKGRKIESLQNVDHKFEQDEEYKRSSFMLDPYSTKMPLERKGIGHEYYSTDIELLSYYLGDYLLGRIVVRGSLVVDFEENLPYEEVDKLLRKIDEKDIYLNHINPMEEIERIIKERFNKLCEELPEVAALLVAFMRGAL